MKVKWKCLKCGKEISSIYAHYEFNGHQAFRNLGVKNGKQ